MHTTPLHHHVPGARNRLLHLAVRALAVDDVKGRRGCHDRELAAEDDHVVGGRGPVLEEGTKSPSAHLLSLPVDICVKEMQGVIRTMGLAECGARSR